jgi:hypothetical protein
MTMLTTQHNKLEGDIGDFLHDVFEPALYGGMKEKNWTMCPYANFDGAVPSTGWPAFYDPPRYSSGYASLFETIAFVPETHMLKPFADRVHSTYAFMQTLIEQASKFSIEIVEKRKKSVEAIKHHQTFALSWKIDSTKFEYINFSGYDTSIKISEVTGLPRFYYDHSKPFERQVKFYNTYTPSIIIQKPKAYIIPQGWHDVIDRLKLNGVAMQHLSKDTSLEVEYYMTDDYKSAGSPYEKHHRNYNATFSTHTASLHFLKGDYIIYTGQSSDRYIVETLEPLGDDSFFSWNFFDAVLQRKEYYSEYRWEDLAAEYLKQHPDVQAQLDEKKRSDAAFAASASDQLAFVYTHSVYNEPEYLRLPLYRVIK